MKALIKEWIAGILGFSAFVSVVILPSILDYAVMERGYKAVGGEWMLIVSIALIITYLFYRAVVRGIRVAYRLGYMAGTSERSKHDD
jgi:hypothetical protein